MASPRVLALALAQSQPEEYVRLTAHWLTEACDLNSVPELTGNQVVDALVAAAAAHSSFQASGSTPPWTREPQRALDSLWYPGPKSLFANALTHAPTAFKLHGVLVEKDSLESV